MGNVTFTTFIAYLTEFVLVMHKFDDGCEFR